MKHLLNDPRLVVQAPGRFRLKDHVTDLPEEADKKELKERLEKDRERISELQELLYAGGRHALLLESMMQTAGNLGLPVSAVGLETNAQWEGLRALGCAEGQGFLFATPLPLEAALHLPLWLPASA